MRGDDHEDHRPVPGVPARSSASRSSLCAYSAWAKNSSEPSAWWSATSRSQFVRRRRTSSGLPALTRAEATPRYWDPVADVLYERTKLRMTVEDLEVVR